ncbi:unnamed protein product [Symbiodinium sp. CCMP2456]|nr:unnamed protein product [Symbiodinium sp. CCMP2456]
MPVTEPSKKDPRVCRVAHVTFWSLPACRDRQNCVPSGKENDNTAKLQWAACPPDLLLLPLSFWFREGVKELGWAPGLDEPGCNVNSIVHSQAKQAGSGGMVTGSWIAPPWKGPMLSGRAEDAAYDLRRFLKTGDMPSLTETTPAIAKSGQQLRFLTFCPDASNNYTMRVTALDANDEPIDYFEDDEMKLMATPGLPPPKGQVTEMTIVPKGQIGKEAEKGALKEPGLEAGANMQEGEKKPDMGDITREIMKEESLKQEAMMKEE